LQIPTSKGWAAAKNKRGRERPALPQKKTAPEPNWQASDSEGYWTKKIAVPFAAPSGSRYGALPVSGKGQGEAENPF
jgi:hypothetical protein